MRFSVGDQEKSLRVRAEWREGGDGGGEEGRGGGR